MKKLFAIALIAVAFAGTSATLALAAEAMAEGIVRSVDQASNTVTLTDGMTLTASTRLSIESLQPGEAATFLYQQEPNGQNEMTSFWIDAGSNGEN
jgi:Protein of unknown function (DUF1344)